MKPNIHTILATLCAAALSFATARAAEEEDKPVEFADLPAAVAKAIKDAAGDAKLKSIVLGDEDGTPAYEAVWESNGHQNEIAVAKDGTVLGLEEIITLAEAPEAIRAAIEKEAGKNKVLEVEKVLEKGKTFFEATIEQGAGKVVVRLNAKGKVLERENPDAEKGEKEEKGEKKEKKD
ncbi:MAG: hypothetical protein ABIZ56_03060 [Chthoniobacteraceae bacterium]